MLLVDGEADVEDLPRGRRERPAVFCPHCGRLGEYRKRQSSMTLTEHFAHASGEECVPEDLANALHARAIAMLVLRISAAQEAGRALLGLVNCRRCKLPHPRVLLAANSWTGVETEVRVTTPSGYRVPDIVVRNGDLPVLFVEVAHTSLVDGQRLNDLRIAGVPGCEVFAIQVVEHPEAEGLPAPRQHWNMEDRGPFFVCALCRRAPPLVPLVSAVIRASGREARDSVALIALGRALAFARPEQADVGDLTGAFENPEQFRVREPAAALECADCPPSEPALRELTRVALGWKGWGAWEEQGLEPTLVQPHSVLIDRILARSLRSGLGENPAAEFAADIAAADQVSRWTDLQRQPKRLECHALLLLHAAAAEGGHTAVDLEYLLGRMQVRLPDLSYDVLRDGLRTLCVERRLFAAGADDKVSVGSAFYAGAEKEAAFEICRLLGRAVRRTVVPDARPSVSLDADQERALTMAHEAAVCVVTGGPGTGKTTLIREVVSRVGGGWFALAPTWKALARLKFALHGVGCVQFDTVAGFVARTIGVLPDGTLTPELARLGVAGWNIVIDEAGCLDSRSLRQLLRGARQAARVLFVGDPEQLPSVAPGAVLRDILASGCVPQVALGITYRTGAESGIPLLARSILAGAPDFSGSAVEFVERASAGIEAEVARRYREAVRGVGPLDVQVLSPVNWLVDLVNGCLQAQCNPAGRPLTARLRVNDPFIATVTTESVTKGETGRVVDLLDRGAVRVELAAGRSAVYDRRVLATLDPAYCLTVHKAQGSEWRRVVFAVPECGRGGFVDRSLLYTAVTRARDSLVMIGSRRGVEEASRRNAASERQSLLSTFLARAPSGAVPPAAQCCGG